MEDFYIIDFHLAYSLPGQVIDRDENCLTRTMKCGLILIKKNRCHGNVDVEDRMKLEIGSLGLKSVKTPCGLTPTDIIIFPNITYYIYVSRILVY